ncbi:MAG: hypothetical protein PHI31_17445 [Desulfuromonadaceae bacterium]|nr:hypothetical protein [Desulfuromonadaceae bacterium]
MQPLIALVDCNNFYVSCERVFRPDLIGKPVAVLSNNDGCIVARSKDYVEFKLPIKCTQTINMIFKPQDIFGVLVRFLLSGLERVAWGIVKRVIHIL